MSNGETSRLKGAFLSKVFIPIICGEIIQQGLLEELKEYQNKGSRYY